MEDPNAALAAAESQAMASARAGLTCSSGMVDRGIAAQWASVDEASTVAEKQRQALQHERNVEIDKLAKAREGHSKQVIEAKAARKLILDEMRSVRHKMEDKVLSARARGTHNMGIANRALVKAGQAALSARGEAERWQAHAQDLEELFGAQADREVEMRVKYEEASGARVAEADANKAGRRQLGQRLVEETGALCEQLRLRHDEHCTVQEFHAGQLVQLQTQRSASAKHEAAAKVQAAVAKSTSEQMASISEIQKSREAASRKVAQAQQDFLNRRLECEATLERERICAAQARKIASTLKTQHEAERQSVLSKLQAELESTQAQALQKVSTLQSLSHTAIERNEAWSARSKNVLTSLQARTSGEERLSMDVVEQAKVSFAKLEAQCVVYLKNLQEQWDHAKREDVAKVEAAQACAEELVRFCEETLASSEKYCIERLKDTESFSEAKKKHLEEKVSALDDLAKQRVAMMREQSKDRREKAETQLAGFMVHIEDVRAQCNERVRVEADTASEKVEMARRRFEEEVALAERRLAEAEASRNESRMTHAAAVARCVGSAMEARRRGLNNIAEVIEPEPLRRYPGWDIPCDTSRAGDSATAEENVAIEDSIAADAAAFPPGALKETDPLLATGATESTAIPEELMTSMSTTREAPSRE
jgi:hypothetical protein